MQEKIQKLKNKKILFVEDEDTLRNATSEIFKKLQIDYTMAKDGKEGLKKFQENEFDLVLTDINMPHMNGLEFIQKAKKTHPNMHFIIMSAHTESEYIKEAESLGVHNYLIKPFDFIKFINLTSSLDFDS